MREINYEYYVSPYIAKLLKEAGFDWEICDGYLVHEDGDVFTTGFQIPYDFNGDNGDLFINHNGHKEYFSRPTLTIAQKWLREVKNVDVFAYRNEPKGKFESIVSFGKEWSTTGMCINTYEEALEAGIKKALEIILKKIM